MQDYDTDEIASVALAGIDAQWPVTKAVLVVFDPDDPPGEHALYSNAAGVRILPVLKAMVARLEAGELRLPVSGGFLWVEADADADER